MSFSIAAALPARLRKHWETDDWMLQDSRAQVFCCEAKQLTQQFETFTIGTTCGLEHHCSEIEGSSFKVLVIVVVFVVSCVVLTWFFVMQIGRREGSSLRRRWQDLCLLATQES